MLRSLYCSSCPESRTEAEQNGSLHSRHFPVSYFLIHHNRLLSSPVSSIMHLPGRSNFSKYSFRLLQSSDTLSSLCDTSRPSLFSINPRLSDRPDDNAVLLLVVLLILLLSYCFYHFLHFTFFIFLLFQHSTFFLNIAFPPYTVFFSFRFPGPKPNGNNSFNV